MAREVYLTKDGYAGLQERLEYLKGTARGEVAKQIGIARDFGDLSENSEYDAAKEAQAKLEAEIAEIEEKLRVAKVINEKNIKTDKVTAGCFVKVKDLDYKDTFEYRIVGSTESDPASGLISNESPVGQALLGKAEGDTIEVTLPENNTTIRLQIIGIRA